MSKTTIFLILLVAGAGLAIGFLTNFNPLTSIQNLITKPSSAVEWLKTLPQTITQNWQALLGVVSGASGMLLVASRAYSNYKATRQQVEQNLQTANAELSKTVTEVQTAKEEAEATFATKQTEFTDTMSKLGTQVSDLSKTNTTLSRQLAQVTKERNDFSSKINALAKEAEELRNKYIVT